jgi:beta-1,2-mannobiose phosphorylase / 1,2-beta-oligomannan phosphorylase
MPPAIDHEEAFVSQGNRAGAWRKHQDNPVISGANGTCFDVSVLPFRGGYRMYLSWRPRRSIAVSESRDGLSWTDPVQVLGGLDDASWEREVNRPSVVQRGGRWQMWYTAQDAREDGTGSRLGYATSADGMAWTRHGRPVMEARDPWEGGNVMCPHVLFDEQDGIYKMWYSAGERYEPDAIGYATSTDGISWRRDLGRPVFIPDPTARWEAHKVTAAQVIRTGQGYVMFYIGFENVDLARIGAARSPDGIDGWERLSSNPIISPDPGAWDGDGCYKPFAIPRDGGWILWYNGRLGHLEQIGAAFHDGGDLGFDG